MSKPNSVKHLILDLLLILLAAAAVVLICIMGHKIYNGHPYRRTDAPSVEQPLRHQTNCIWINE